MLAFAMARGTNSGIFPLQSGSAPKEVSFYALGQASGIQCVVLINKTLDQPLRISLSDVPLRNASCIRLVAPSPESTVDITLGGARVDATGKWSPTEAEPVTREVLLPPCSAMIVHRRP
jgi:hypothetical protein